MREEEVETAIKVVIVGNGAVGKSSMIQRYCKGIFTKDYKKTIGVDFLERQIDMDGEDIRLMLWDTAGQEEFDAITKAYYRGAQACVLAYSTTDRNSFEAIHSWKKKVEDEVGEITMVLVQNKIDLEERAVVRLDEAEALAKSLRLRLYRTSVKDNRNVEEVFSYLCENYLNQACSINDDDCKQETIGGGSDFMNSNGDGKHGQLGKKNKHWKNRFRIKNNKKSSDGTIILEPSKRRTQGRKNPINKCLLL
ncbi:ras-related protein Rab-23-like [Tubulanus polymorphus]|uniref:ras-related protein Rab-23-like n=1 Tax=Tubulanus polymorphus TaxID=672921 RepID=UPI003DA2D129